MHFASAFTTNSCIAAKVIYPFIFMISYFISYNYGLLYLYSGIKQRYIH